MAKAKMKAELLLPTATLLREVFDLRMRRKDVAITYALALQSSYVTDWGKVNHAIVVRWSYSSLEWIKTQAWKRLDLGRRPHG